MAGIYLHVPFCRVKCHYCDFHFSTQLKHKAALVEAMQCELVLRQLYLNDQTIGTIYFGGGTPSILEIDQLEQLLATIKTNFTVLPGVEITLECNPDDMTREKLEAWKQLGINRLSIGVQSFRDDFLTFMNRAHSAKEAVQSIEWAQQKGFDNLTIDLIYGIPGSSMNYWKQELEQMKKLGVPHLSAYCLTIEENTVFGNWKEKGKLTPFPDKESLLQFQYLMDFTASNGLEQYEISNFARPGFISQHNSAYWKGVHYLGVGPSAHSYNGIEREWNIANNHRYAKQIELGESFSEKEILSVSDRFNDYILTRLRTIWGVDMDDLQKIDPKKAEAVVSVLTNHCKAGNLEKEKTIFRLTNEGKYIADAISADLFQ